MDDDDDDDDHDDGGKLCNPMTKGLRFPSRDQRCNQGYLFKE